MLVSLNPYKDIPLLYDLPDGGAIDEARPHVYAVAAAARRAARNAQTPQSVVISGESGAGKTEASKKVMAYLLAAGGQEDGAVDVESVLMVSNVVLEAFGNAKTVRNDNSSRFGKRARRADVSPVRRGDAAAATRIVRGDAPRPWIFRGDASRPRRG